MNDTPAQPTRKQSPEPAKESREELIFTPISLARARHASSQMGLPTVERPRQTAAETGLSPEAPAGAGAKPAAGTAKNSNGDSSGTPGCLLVSLLGVVFVVGGILGGVAGGGMLLWATNSGNVSIVADAPAPTPSPLPSPAPAETPPPTPTPRPPRTPSPADAIEAVMPSVVTVVNQQHLSNAAQQDEGRVVGSGVIVDSRGYIATNNHVVDHPGELKIVLSDGRETMAELIAANPAEDLAILKINMGELPAIEWGNSRNLRPGQEVYAIGSPLGDFPNSVSFGIVSGLYRALEIDKFVIDGLIQTDAAINRGSSGGPLITPDGKVVAINTFIIRESEERGIAEGIAEGIAFAIPAETAKNLLIPWIAAHAGESVPIPASNGTN